MDVKYLRLELTAFLKMIISALPKSIMSSLCLPPSHHEPKETF